MFWMIPLAMAAPDKWEETLEKVTHSVVSIRMDRPIAYDGNKRSNSQATGFVIDAELGLILTNRHVVSAGPTTAEAIFLNQEEVRLEPIYRDPVHDFGLFRFDPNQLKYHVPETLSLNPKGAQVGVEIRVVGNDAGEKLSILDGTLARIDRSAPTYGWGYNDFNTFYIQAASATSGGSSGSPVVNQNGEVVALNAGSSTRAASAFYLPLDRVVYAVDRVRKGLKVHRGTLQARWQYTTFDELLRRGLSEETEAKARKAQPNGTGMLVIEEVVPQGPVHGMLQTGDVILSVDGEPTYDFVTFEAKLDDRVGEPIEIVVERAGERVTVTPTVDDLHAITPSKVLQVGLTTLHNLSYHQARLNRVPTMGVLVAEAGYLLNGMPTDAVIVELNGELTKDIDVMQRLLEEIPTGDDFTIRWYARGQARDLRVATFTMDRDWFSMRSCEMDEQGSWPCTDAADPPAASKDKRRPKAPALPSSDKRAAAVQSKLVSVRARIPYEVAGVHGNSFVGMGLIVDAEKGLVICDRDTVPIVLADVRLRINEAVEIPAKVVAVHPTNNLAVVQYDPADAKGLGLQGFTLAASGADPSDKLYAVGAGGAGSSASAERTSVERMDPVRLRMGPSVPV